MLRYSFNKELERFEMKKLQVTMATLISVLLVSTLSACAPGKLSMDNVTAIIDTRTAEAFNESHIVGAVNIDIELGDFIVTAVSIKKEGAIYIYGETVEQAAQAVEYMRGLRYPNVYNLGTFADAQNVLPLGVTE
jgi:rhodanese-related sulfurtransferase